MISRDKILLKYLRHSPLDHGKSALAKAISASSLPEKLIYTLSPFGPKFELELNDPGDRKVFLFNSIERNTERHLRSLLKLAPTPLCFIDCGANVGFYSLLTASIQPQASIHAFEPHPKTFKRLQRNVGLNFFRNIHANQAAVSDAAGFNILHFGDHLGTASLMAESPRNHAVEVEVTTLDCYCQANRIHQVDFLKVDVEGSEWKVIDGAAKLLQESKNIVVILELIDELCRRSGYAGAELFQRMIRDGFQAFLPRGWPFSLERIGTYPADYFDNIIFIKGDRYCPPSRYRTGK